MGIRKRKILSRTGQADNYFVIMTSNNSNHKWYHFGRWIEPALSSGIWLDFKNTAVFRLEELNSIEEVRQLDGYYFLLQKDVDEISVFVEKNILNKPEWFNDFFAICDKKLDDILNLKNGGESKLDEFFEATVETANCSMAIEFLDCGLEKYLKKLSIKTNISVEEVLSQVKPFKKTPFIKYYEDLKNLKEKNIPSFVKKWEWIGTHFFMGSGLIAEKVKKEISEISKKEDEKEGEKENKIKLPDEYKKIIEIGSKLTYYRTSLVEITNSVAYKYWPIIEKIGKDNGLSWDEVLLLTHHELAVLRDKKTLPENFQERKNGFGVVIQNNKVRVVVGEELKRQLEECQEKVDKNIIEIEGMVVFKSDKKVIGVVKVIEESKYISKINKGEILVTNETTPDYVVGMKIAGAIITNQGGITSHAAIVSRELKIPCIVGTKIATKVLKDGDLVEVDAEKGIVKILNRK